MKIRNYIRAWSAGILLGVLPVMISAKGLVDDRTALSLSSRHRNALVDSLPETRTQDDKNKDSKKKTEADKEKDPKQDPKTVEIDKKNKPGIKEVPKARPKLRPGVVTDRVKIKRPPVKVKPGRVLRIGPK